MSLRGRPRVGLDPCIDRVEEIAHLHAAGYGTAAIQSKLGGRRSTISRVRALLTAAEERGRATVAGGTGDAESARGAFPKCAEERKP